MKTTLTVDDDGMLQIPDDMLEQLGWKEGDVLEWVDNQDGSFLLRKPTMGVESTCNSNF
jgi:bifunctional DNA-binding transcriptional regulator/antitoxin component of YhaV-PrlF toxin-antitoxin module